MSQLLTRLTKLEVHTRSRLPKIRLFAYEAPAEIAAGAEQKFLRSCGHDPQPHDIIIKFVGAENGKPKDLPWRDRTATVRGQGCTAE
ncbi:hypothetical protein [Methylobacterium sp. WSM2598]|uniref:hypothetical protein n=1 Tax=Methylobacterium sp. WSM2598 TaxID=398261 RepID=UPI000367E66B|nr:hypothetical protein [Methylobacterium sp. WSM2598]